MGLRAWLAGQDLEERSGPPWHPAGQWPRLDVETSDPLLGAVSFDQLALQVPTAYRCIDLITSQLAQFPMVAHRDGEPLEEQPRVLRRPDPRGHYRVFVMRTVRDLLFRGAACWRVAARDDQGRALVLEHVDASLVTVQWNPRRGHSDAVLNQDRVVYIAGTPAPAQSDLVYIPMIELPGQARGYGPVEAAHALTTGQVTADNLVRSNFTDGVYPSGSIEVERTLSPSAAEALRSQFVDRNRGKREPVVMSGGATFQPFSQTLRDQQWIEARSWGASEIARLYGVPHAMLSLPTQGGGSLNYSNAVSVRRDWAIQGLSPIAARLEVAFQVCLPSTQEAVMDFTDWLEEVAPNVTPNQPDPAPAADTANVAQAQARLEPDTGNQRVM